MSAFHVGMKVVCIDAAPNSSPPPPGIEWTGDMGGLTVGCVYTVAAIGEHEASRVPSIKLCEIHRRYSDWFRMSRFRPVAYPKQSLEHDVQTFLKIADRAPAPKKRVRA